MRCVFLERLVKRNLVLVAVVCRVPDPLLERLIVDSVVRRGVGCGEEEELDALTSDDVQVVGGKQISLD